MEEAVAVAALAAMFTRTILGTLWLFPLFLLADQSNAWEEFTLIVFATFSHVDFCRAGLLERFYGVVWSCRIDGWELKVVDRRTRTLMRETGDHHPIVFLAMMIVCPARRVPLRAAAGWKEW